MRTRAAVGLLELAELVVLLVLVGGGLGFDGGMGSDLTSVWGLVSQSRPSQNSA